MIGLIIIVAVTAAIGFLLWWFDGRRHKEEKSSVQQVSSEAKDESAEASVQGGESGDEECCGMHIVCEKNSLSPVDTKIEYFDDEEIDRFRGREAGDYTDEEIEEFRDILLTLRPSEIAAWARSLQLRGIVMPQTIRDELLLIVSEERAKAAEPES